MSWLIDMMLAGLNFFYFYTGNYGVSIIVLTILVNIALYPLALSSIVQMAVLQKVQPKIQELQKKHKDKPAEMQKELAELYKKEKINPFGGCLPMLLKIPFFIGFFMAFISINFPAGVQLYWVVSSVVGALQQMFIIKYAMPAKESF